MVHRWSVLSSFPASAVKVRRATVLLAVRRHLIELAKAEKEAPVLEQQGKKGDFVDRVHHAATTVSKKQASVNIAVEMHNKSRLSRRAGSNLVSPGLTDSDQGALGAESNEVVEAVQTAVKALTDRVGRGGLTQCMHPSCISMHSMHSLTRALSIVCAVGGEAREGARRNRRGPHQQGSRHQPALTPYHRLIGATSP